jgi:hypothetical protein
MSVSEDATTPQKTPRRLFAGLLRGTSRKSEGDESGSIRTLVSPQSPSPPSWHSTLLSQSQRTVPLLTEESTASRREKAGLWEWPAEDENALDTI